jgi:hypothetical protein
MGCTYDAVNTNTVKHIVTRLAQKTFRLSPSDIELPVGSDPCPESSLVDRDVLAALGQYGSSLEESACVHIIIFVFD